MKAGMNGMRSDMNSEQKIAAGRVFCSFVFRCDASKRRSRPESHGAFGRRSLCILPESEASALTGREKKHNFTLILFVITQN